MFIQAYNKTYSKMHLDVLNRFPYEGQDHYGLNSRTYQCAQHVQQGGGDNYIFITHFQYVCF